MVPPVLLPSPELATFVFLVAATPGPLNLGLLSIGLTGRARFGLGALLSAAATYGALYAVASSTARQLADLHPAAFQALQVAAAALLLWLAWKIATARPGAAADARPGAARRGLRAGALAGAAIVGIGAKSWSSALAAALLFCDGRLGPAEHAIQFGGLATAMILLFCGPWLVAGLWMGRRIASSRALRGVNLASGGVLAGLAVMMVVQ